MSQKHLTKQESIAIASSPIGISFNTFISKGILQQILIERSRGIRIYFGEENCIRTIVTVASSNSDLNRGRSSFLPICFLNKLAKV